MENSTIYSIGDIINIKHNNSEYSLIINGLWLPYPDEPNEYLYHIQYPVQYLEEITPENTSIYHRSGWYGIKSIKSLLNKYGK